MFLPRVITRTSSGWPRPWASCLVRWQKGHEFRELNGDWKGLPGDLNVILPLGWFHGVLKGNYTVLRRFQWNHRKIGRLPIAKFDARRIDRSFFALLLPMDAIRKKFLQDGERRRRANERFTEWKLEDRRLGLLSTDLRSSPCWELHSRQFSIAWDSRKFLCLVWEYIWGWVKICQDQLPYLGESISINIHSHPLTSISIHSHPLTSYFRVPKVPRSWQPSRATWPCQESMASFLHEVHPRDTWIHLHT